MTDSVECFGIRRREDGKYIGFDTASSSRVRAAGYPMPVNVVPGRFVPDRLVTCPTCDGKKLAGGRYCAGCMGTGKVVGGEAE